MNILSVNTFFPYPPRRGMDIIYLNLLKLQSQHHNVTVLTLGRNGDEESFIGNISAYCKKVYVVKPPNAKSFFRKAFYRAKYSLASWLLWRPMCTFYDTPPELSALVAQLTGSGVFDLVEIHHSPSAQLAGPVRDGAKILYMYDVHFRSRERLASTRRGLGKFLASFEARNSSLLKPVI